MSRRIRTATSSTRGWEAAKWGHPGSLAQRALLGVGFHLPGYTGPFTSKPIFSGGGISGRAGRNEKERQVRRGGCLSDIIFVPIAIETLGAWSSSASEICAEI